MKLGLVQAVNPAAVRIDVISPELNSAGFTALILKSIPPFMCEPHTSCFIRKPHDKFKKKKKERKPAHQHRLYAEQPSEGKQRESFLGAA